MDLIRYAHTGQIPITITQEIRMSLPDRLDLDVTWCYYERVMGFRPTVTHAMRDMIRAYDGMDITSCQDAPDHSHSHLVHRNPEIGLLARIIERVG